MGDDAGVCIQCGQPMHKTDKFCPECGHKVEVVEVVEILDDPGETRAEEPTAPPPRRSRRTLVIAGVAAIGLILAGAAWWGLTQNSAAKDQYKRPARC